MDDDFKEGKVTVAYASGLHSMLFPSSFYCRMDGDGEIADRN